MSNDEKDLAAPINIFSGEPGLGAALTNPTELARSKGMLSRAYRVTYAGQMHGDAEAAYHLHKRGDAEADDRMMAEIIAAKFRQHPALAEEVRARGGADWLASCSHFTGARSPGAQSWEGAGLSSSLPDRSAEMDTTDARRINGLRSSGLSIALQ